MVMSLTDFGFGRHYLGGKIDQGVGCDEMARIAGNRRPRILLSQPRSAFCSFAGNPTEDLSLIEGCSDRED